MIRVRAACRLLAAAAALLVPAVASAAPHIEVTHIQGASAPWTIGWNEAVVSVENPGGAFRGEVLVNATRDAKDVSAAIVRVPISLAAGEGARVIVPFYTGAGGFPAVVLASNGEAIDPHPLGLTVAVDNVATVVEINGTNPMGARLVEAPAPPTSPSPSPSPTTTPPSFDDDEDEKPPAPPPSIPKLGTGTGFLGAPFVSTVQFARESGDPILPDIAPAWAGAALVVVPSDVLNRVQGKARDALLAYVNAGGTLAIAVAHEEDLRGDFVKTLVGGEARLTSTSSPEYSGGKLHRSAGVTGGDEGDVAPYGLGEAWLLHHDPWSRPPDAKSPTALFSIYARARQRRVAFPVARNLSWLDDDHLRQLLDPNFGFRPALGVAAVLVLLYAFLVGPIAFARARKLGKPLSVLRAVPISAAVLFVSLVAIGKLGKGFRGRVRKLEIVDLASGLTAGTTTTFHSFYVGDPSAIDLVASNPINGLHLVEPNDANAPIDLDRAGIAVRAVRAHPWQAAVIEEEGVRAIDGDGIKLEGDGLRLTLTNDTPWTLEHVILHPKDPGIPPRSRYFAKVGPGESVVARDGVLVERSILPTAIDGKGPLAASPSDKTRIEFQAIEAVEGIGGAYGTQAIPLDLPVAMMIAHPPSSTEGGFSIEQDVVFLRVVGSGFSSGSSSEGSKPEAPTGKEGEL